MNADRVRATRTPGDAVLDLVCSGEELPLRQLAILLMISDKPGHYSVCDFMRALLISRSSASRSLTTLVERGLATHGVNTTNRRLLAARPTRRGDAIAMIFSPDAA